MSIQYNNNVFNNVYNIQINQFSNPLNIKVSDYRNFNNEMIDYGVNIINKAYSLMNDLKKIAEYIGDSFNSKFPQDEKWNCFIVHRNSIGYRYWCRKFIWFSTNKEDILLFQ